MFHECVLHFFELYTSAPTLMREIPWHVSLRSLPVMDSSNSVDHNYAAMNVLNLTTLSVAGGFRDYQVRSGLTFLPQLSHHTSALSVVVIFLKDSTDIVT